MTLWTKTSRILYGSWRGKANRQHRHAAEDFSRSDLAANALNYALRCAEAIRDYRHTYGLRFISAWCFQGSVDSAHILLDELTHDESDWVQTVVEPHFSDTSLLTIEECYRSILVGGTRRTMAQMVARAIHQRVLTVRKSLLH